VKKPTETNAPDSQSILLAQR